MVKRLTIYILKKGVMKVTLLFCCFLLFSQVIYSEENTYSTEKRLFHIARSKNKNLVCYDANITNGKLDTKNPLTIYWVNREDNPGTTSKLTTIQKKLAYGYKINSQGDDTCEITLSAYPGRKLTIEKQGSEYVCFITINNKKAILQSLYVKAKPSNSLSVEYVELQGITTDAKLPVSEKVNNTKL